MPRPPARAHDVRVDSEQERAFERFAAECGNSLLRLAMALTSDRNLAEEVYQETLHRLAARWARVENPWAFCRRVMRNIVIDQARHQARQVRQVPLPDRDDGGLRAPDVAAAVELRLVLRDALATLTLRQRTILVLRYVDDRSENEVAGLLGLTPGTVKSTASRAAAQLRINLTLAEGGPNFRPMPVRERPGLGCPRRRTA
jgi:RNA polymerase sigma factor (sigma-70 family)